MQLNWKTVVFVGLFVASMSGLGGYHLGKSQAPAKVEVVEVEKVVIVEKEVVKVVEVEKVVQAKKVNKNLNKSIHRERIEETKPDGSKIVREIEDINLDRTIVQLETKYVDRTIEVEKIVEVEKKVEVEKLVTVQSATDAWMVGVKLGTAIPPRLTPFPPYVDPVIVGLEVNRHLIGPVHVGAWAMSNSTLTNTMGGLSLNVRF